MGEFLLALLSGLLLVAGGALLLLLLVAVLRSRRQKDPCLAAFEGFHVTLQRQDGRNWSGVLALTSHGFELAQADAGVTYLHYAVEYQNLQCLSRYIEGLRAGEASRRLSQIERDQAAERPWRGLRTLVAAIQEILTEVLLSRGQPPAPDRAPIAGLPSGETHLMGYAGTQHDALLERSLGARVVCQLLMDGALFRRVGTLLAYSADFLLLADVLMPQQRLLRFEPDQDPHVEAGVRLQQDGRRIEITNLSDYPLLLDSLHLGGQVRDLGMQLDAKASFSLHAGGIQPAAIELSCQVVHNADLIVPRSRAVIRYRGAVSRLEGLFDVGIALTADEDAADLEERLRWDLRRQPANAAAAASLARLLYRKGDLGQAETYFLQALAHPRALADGGRRVQRELAELRQHRQQTGEGAR